MANNHCLYFYLLNSKPVLQWRRQSEYFPNSFGVTKIVHAGKVEEATLVHEVFHISNEIFRKFVRMRQMHTKIRTFFVTISIKHRAMIVLIFFYSFSKRVLQGNIRKKWNCSQTKFSYIHIFAFWWWWYIRLKYIYDIVSYDSYGGIHFLTNCYHCKSGGKQ